MNQHAKRLITKRPNILRNDVLALLNRFNLINLFAPPINSTTEKRPSAQNSSRIRLFIVLRFVDDGIGIILGGASKTIELHYSDKTMTDLLKRHSIIYLFIFYSRRTGPNVNSMQRYSIQTMFLKLIG